MRVALALARWPVGWLRVFPPAGPPARRFSVSTAPSPRPSDPLAPAFASDRAEQLSQLGPRSIPQRPAINMQFVTTVRYAKKSRWAQLETAYDQRLDQKHTSRRRPESRVYLPYFSNFFSHVAIVNVRWSTKAQPGKQGTKSGVMACVVKQSSMGNDLSLR